MQGYTNSELVYVEEMDTWKIRPYDTNSTYLVKAM